MELTLERPRLDAPASPDVRRAFRPRWWLVFCAVAAAFAGLFTSNQFLTSASVLSLPVICYFTWREGEPPVLAFGCIFQWLQATAAIFYTDWFHLTLEDAYGDRAMTMATWLSLGAVITLAAGIRLGLTRFPVSQCDALESEAGQCSISSIAILYFVTSVCAAVIERLAWQVPSLTQPLLAFASLKWTFVFMLSYSILQQHRGYALLVACVLFEFASGLLGVFAGFKSVFFVLVVAAMTSPLALKGRRLAISLLCFVTMLTAGIVWTAVKMDYRSYLADDESGEVSSSPAERRFGRLADLVGALDAETIGEGLEGLVMRLSYVNFFALSIENVPARVPYENGRLWAGSVEHALMPRLLFPNKPVIDDSERTRLYTGIFVSGAEQGTSISIGYVGESYIDFGPVGMFAPILGLGIFYGLLYRMFALRTRYKFFGCSLAVSVLIFSAYEIEASNIKLVGGVAVAAIASAIVYKFAGRRITAFIGIARPEG